MRNTKFAAAAWALAPVIALAFHYGPGQRIYRHDVAASLHEAAADLEREARGLQEQAHAAHLAAIEARQRAFVAQTPEAEAAVKKATETETAAFEAASAGWKRVAEALGEIHKIADGADDETLQQVRWARSRALVRAGEIWQGIGELESLLGEVGAEQGETSELALAVRQELGTAHYYGARLRRLAGDPEEEWLVDSGKARQHFRYLAEHAREAGLPTDRVESHERDVELVLNLEQSALMDILGKPLPQDSPGRCIGDRPGKNTRKTQRPPQNRDGRGAGGAEEVRTGW